ncbi:MAG: hypothetical protein E4H20_05670, partial [Spirochaetales bacterium]
MKPRASGAVIALILSLAAAGRLAAQIEAKPGWYRSDQAGLAYETTSATEAPGLPWSLFVESNNSRRTESLYADGEISRRTVIEFNAAGMRTRLA